MKINLNILNTAKFNLNSINIDMMDTDDILKIINDALPEKSILFYLK